MMVPGSFATATAAHPSTSFSTSDPAALPELSWGIQSALGSGEGREEQTKLWPPTVWFSLARSRRQPQSPPAPFCLPFGSHPAEARVAVLALCSATLWTLCFGCFS